MSRSEYPMAIYRVEGNGVCVLILKSRRYIGRVVDRLGRILHERAFPRNTKIETMQDWAIDQVWEGPSWN